MTERAPADVYETVARRADLLGELRDEPREKRTLASALSVSRSTIDRAVGELAALGFVAESDGLIHTTVAGDIVTDLYRDTVGRIDELLAMGSTLDGLDERLRPSPSFFGSTRVVTGDDGPRAPAERLIAAFLDADRCRLVRGVIRPSFAADVRERMLDGSLTIDAVLCADSVDSLRTYHTVDLDGVLERETVSVSRLPDTLHSGLYLFETDGNAHVSLSVHDESDDRIRALLTTERPAAVVWAERVFETERARASPVTAT
jgi:predicted transcriptional regulator